MTNMVLLGALLANLPVLPLEALEKSLEAHLPARHHRLLPPTRRPCRPGPPALLSLPPPEAHQSADHEKPPKIIFGGFYIYANTGPTTLRGLAHPVCAGPFQIAVTRRGGSQTRPLGDDKKDRGQLRVSVRYRERERLFALCASQRTACTHMRA